MTPMGLAPGAIDTPNTPTYTVKVMGLSPTGAAGMLRPGQQGVVEVYFTALLGDNEFVVYTNTADNATPLDYSMISSAIRPDGYTDAQWSTILAKLEQLIGPTDGDYDQMLAANASILPASAGNNAEPDSDLQIELQRAIAATGTSITGAVTASDSTLGLAGRTVYANNTTTGDLFTAQTLADGSVIFDSITPGSYTFTVSGALIDGSPTANVANSQTVTGVSLALALAGVISGQITETPAASALSNPIVTAIGSDGTSYSAILSPTGFFSITGLPPDTYTLTAQADGFARGELDGIVVDGKDVIQGVSLSPESTITGSVALATGGPSDNTLVVQAALTGSTDPFAIYDGVVSGADHTIGNLPAGTYDVSIIEDGYVTQTIPGVVVASAVSVAVGSTTLPVAASVSGLMTTTDPAFSIPITSIGLFQNGTFVAGAYVDDDDTFTISGVPAGTYQFEVAGTTDLVVAPTITLAAGQDLTGVTVSVQPVAGGSIDAIHPAGITVFQSTELSNDAILSTKLEVEAQSRLADLQSRKAAIPAPCPRYKDLYDQLRSSFDGAIQAAKDLLTAATNLDNGVQALNSFQFTNASSLAFLTSVRRRRRFERRPRPRRRIGEDSSTQFRMTLTQLLLGRQNVAVSRGTPDNLPRLRRNPTRDPLDETGLFVPSGDLQRREAIVVAGRQVGSLLNEECKGLWASVPFGREVGRSSAALSAGVDIRAVRNQPADRPVIPLMGERL